MPRRLGCAPNGEQRVETRPGVVERELRFRLARGDLRRREWDLTVDGAETAAAFLGLNEDDGGRAPAAAGDAER